LYFQQTHQYQVRVFLKRRNVPSQDDASSCLGKLALASELLECAVIDAFEKRFRDRIGKDDPGLTVEVEDELRAMQ